MRPAAPAAGSLLLAGACAWFHYSGYTRLLAKHSWTAASVTLGIGAALTVLAAILGWHLGRALRDLAAPEGDRKRPALVASAILLFTGYMSFAMVTGRAREARLDLIRTEPVTAARAEEIIASGTRDDLRALSYNRGCPPEIMRKLALSPDYSVRANTAGNPATPDDVVAVLAKDSNEAVRTYADFHPSRRRESDGK